jgi:hypothetical protein
MKKYLFLALLFLPLSSMAGDTLEYSSDPSKGSGIGYSSVNDGLSALKKKEGVSIRVEGGWTVIEDRKDHAVWSFTPDGHPAHPAAIKRSLFEKDGGLYMTMNVLCQATKKECDKLVTEFQELNKLIQKSMQKGE